MAVDIPSTLTQIAAMPMVDQITLLHQAWDQLLDAGWEPQLTEAQQAELDRRLNDLDANPQNVLSVDEMLQRVRRPR